MTGRGRIKIKISFTLLDLKGVSSHVHNIFAPAEETWSGDNAMVGSLIALKHFTTFPTENFQIKRTKPLGILKVEKKEEYFEDDTIKIEPMDQSLAEPPQAPANND